MPHHTNMYDHLSWIHRTLTGAALSSWHQSLGKVYWGELDRELALRAYLGESLVYLRGLFSVGPIYGPGRPVMVLTLWAHLQGRISAALQMRQMRQMIHVPPPHHEHLLYLSGLLSGSLHHQVSRKDSVSWLEWRWHLLQRGLSR